MVRTFVTLEGEILSEEEWTPTLNKSNHCFWCDDHLIGSEAYVCPFNPFAESHDWVTLCSRDYV
jgi:hypothetical protein